MITPSFSIAQDDKQLVFTIKAPYAKIADTEIEYVDDIFMFSSPPYYLRVHLPREVVDDNSGTARYDSTAGEFIVNVPKKNVGENFPNLDMITELLNPQKKISAQQLVEEVADDAEEENLDDIYLIEQNITDVSAGCTENTETNCGYGFAWKRNGVLGQLSQEIGALVELTNPEHTPISERSGLCRQKDLEAFDPERYLIDFMEPDDGLKAAMDSKFGLQLKIDADDVQRLKDFPKKKLPRLSRKERRSVALSVIDFVFAFAYDSRINEWEICCESGWNYVKLAPSLAFLCRWENATEALVGCVRRSMCYPLYRNWDLALKVVEDTKRIISEGRSAILHILCKIHEVLITSGEFRYLFNDLFITEYCIWIQSVDDDVLHDLQKELAEVKIRKGDLGLDLDELELEGKMTAMKVKESEQLDSDDERQ
ncbi:unnamed protein product [Cylicocyclus nassatus]|uniref:Protein SHQ1 homolog n=1 Tax=Cylicocyclus nassatus TaxID=53992 RepID=A0AA36M9U1_CYLNA|nr:unnamed protein product [Cylicocyclus nassatus]